MAIKAIVDLRRVPDRPWVAAQRIRSSRPPEVLEAESQDWGRLPSAQEISCKNKFYKKKNLGIQSYVQCKDFINSVWNLTHFVKKLKED